jgi:hypothetical protein
VRGEHPLSLYSPTSPAPVQLPPIRSPPVCLRLSITSPVDYEIGVGFMNDFADPSPPPPVEAADGAPESAEELEQLKQDIEPLSPPYLWVPVAVAVDNEIDVGLMDDFADLPVEAATQSAEELVRGVNELILQEQENLPSVTSPQWTKNKRARRNEEESEEAVSN